MSRRRSLHVGTQLPKQRFGVLVSVQKPLQVHTVVTFPLQMCRYDQEVTLKQQRDH